MMPSLSLTSSSPSSATTSMKVEKATSELLSSPDWTMNMEICDLFNTNRWMAKDVAKGVKRRLQHKSTRVQLLTLTLLETMVKNCGEYIHHQIAERKILDEMIKLVKKKGDMLVRDKILLLVDSWQEAFGGPGGKYSQYYWACDELRRVGARFPQRSQNAAPVITPPVTHQPRVPQIGYNTRASSSRRLEEAMTSEVEALSLSTLESMRNALELLDDMLQAVNPNDRMAVRDEVIVDLVEHCRTNQKKLMQMITTTTDENLLAQGLQVNDSLQSVLAKNDAIASGAPLPNHGRRISAPQKESVNPNTKISEARDKHPLDNGKTTVSAAPVENDEIEEEDEFIQISQRHSNAKSGTSQIGTSGAAEDGASSSGSNNVLALIDAPAPVPSPETTTTINSSKEQDLIDLMSLVLTTTSTSETLEAPSSTPASNTLETPFNSYVVPWAQAQPQPQQLMQPLPQNVYQPMQSQAQHVYSPYGPAYPPPPWEANSGYGAHQNLGTNPYMYTNYQGNMNNAAMPMQGAWSPQNMNGFQYPQYGNQPMYQTSQQAGANFSPAQINGSLSHSNSFQNPSPINTTPALNGTTLITNNGSTFNPSGDKPFVPSYRLFEDLNVLGSSEGKLKNGPYSNASGN